MDFLSKRVNKIKPSLTLAISDKAKNLRAKGENIISLAAGEPDFDTPMYVKDFAKNCLADNKVAKYTQVDGIPDLKKAIIEKFNRDNSLSYKAEEILVSVGAKQSLYNLCQAILNKGDEVIIPAPYWVSYPDMVLLAGAKPIFIPTTKENSFKITSNDLAKVINSKTKLFIINSPSNPSGQCYTKEELTDIANLLIKHKHILIASDEIYEYIHWGNQFYSILNVSPELKDRIIICNGVSKSYAMTGWRIGYAAGNKDIIKAMKKIQSQSTSCPTAIAQYAACSAISGDQKFVKNMVTTFKERHDYFYQKINQIKGFSALASSGSFYLFVDVKGAIDILGLKNDLEFADFLLSELKIACVPGSAFGVDNYIRISFATDMNNLKIALDRIGSKFN